MEVPQSSSCSVRFRNLIKLKQDKSTRRSKIDVVVGPRLDASSFGIFINMCGLNIEGVLSPFKTGNYIYHPQVYHEDKRRIKT